MSEKIKKTKLSDVVRQSDSVRQCPTVPEEESEDTGRQGSPHLGGKADRGQAVKAFMTIIKQPTVSDIVRQCPTVSKNEHREMQSGVGAPVLAEAFTTTIRGTVYAAQEGIGKC